MKFKMEEKPKKSINRIAGMTFKTIDKGMYDNITTNEMKAIKLLILILRISPSS
jgi:hypothetical protein